LVGAFEADELTVPSAFYGVVEPCERAEARRDASPLLSQALWLRRNEWALTWSAVGEASVFCDGDSGAAFLGELYNAAELRRDLEARTDLSPAGLLLRARRRWPTRFFRRVDAIGVLACWCDGTLELYRDDSAARYLYYSILPAGGVAFATRLDLMLKLPGVQRRLSRPSLHEYLRFLDISAPHTLYEGIHALEAGRRLAWSDGQARVDPIPTDDTVTARPGSIGEAVDTLEGFLQASIERRLAGVERPAAFLSGGVDSSLICALARRVNPQTTAVTVGFHGVAYDEAPAAGAVARHLRLEHRVLRFDRRQCIDALEALGRHCDQPVADPAAPVTLLALEQCGNRYGAVLDGTGADESVGVMPPRHVRVAVQYADRLPGYVRRRVAAAMSRLPWLRSYTPIFDFEHPAELMIRWQGFARQEIEALCDEAVSFEHTHFFRTFARFPRAAHFERYSALDDAMPNDRLHEAVAMTGASVRFPYFESRVDGFIRSLPVDYRFQPGAPKRVLRELLARHVPRALWDGPKHGFNFPLAEFLRAEDCALVRRSLDEARWHQWGLMDPGKVAEYGRRFIEGDGRLAFRVWTLIVLAAWLEAHTADW
jgi:asparagine synthase (glutamine-hydrolysing)